MARKKKATRSRERITVRRSKKRRAGRKRVPTDRQQRFVLEYLKDTNAAQAAIRAGYSPHTSSRIGPELLDKPWVQELIERGQERQAKKLDVTVEKIVRELARIAFSDISRMAEWGENGIKLKDSSKLSEDDRRAVSSLSETIAPGGIKKTKFRLHDKKGALDSLAKHFGMFVERHMHEVNVSWAGLVKSVDANNDEDDDDDDDEEADEEPEAQAS